jgi:Ulp1 family protease
MSEKLLLNYHDAVIYSSDLSILESPNAWLNDACINFQMTCLQHRKQSNDSCGSRDLDDLFLDP